MVKKLQKMADKKAASAAGLLDSQLAHSVKESAQQIWLAGMGAFAKAQAEGGKVFEALVREGASLQKKTQGIAEERISAVTGKMTAMADGMSGKAGAQWDKLETIFEERVAKALNKMGVPSSKDIDALIKRIDDLSSKVGGKGAGKAAPARKTAAAPVRKTAVGKAPPKVAKVKKFAATANKRTGD
jgi:poly(hydroxyalkanoate) granule-associated protein